MIGRRPCHGALFALLFTVLSLLASPAVCSEPAQSPDVILYFYTAETCPHCQEVRPYVQELTERHPGLLIIEKDIWTDRAAFRELADLLATHNDPPLSTPALFLGHRYWVGLPLDRLDDVEAAISRCRSVGCPDALKRLDETDDKAGGFVSDDAVQESRPESVMVPLWGEFDLQEASLPLITVVLGALDSFNPCAFFVLLFLLSLMIHAHSRARMLVVGTVFITFSGLIYFLFMAAWLNLFLMIEGMAWITMMAGLVAVAVGAINIKDFFFYRRGLSLVMTKSAKNSLYTRVRHLVQVAEYPGLITGTVLLAIAANSYELLCTAGFPMVYTRLLTLHDLPTWHYYAYLGLYNVVYVLPLLLIVVLFAMTLGAHKLSEHGGQVLKLISGVMMVVLGAVLLGEPSLLSNLAGTLVMLILAASISGLILIIDLLSHKSRNHVRHEE